MSSHPNILNPSVSEFLDALNHPLRQEIEALRGIIMESGPLLEENIKWNGPNYVSHGMDCITIKIQPPKLIQIIFHRGAKVKEQPAERLISDNSGLLAWRENDRAIATFKTLEEINIRKADLVKIVKLWIEANAS